VHSRARFARVPFANQAAGMDDVAPCDTLWRSAPPILPKPPPGLPSLPKQYPQIATNVPFPLSESDLIPVSQSGLRNGSIIIVRYATPHRTVNDPMAPNPFHDICGGDENVLSRVTCDGHLRNVRLDLM
jgi:hypothetical protein